MRTRGTPPCSAGRPISPSSPPGSAGTTSSTRSTRPYSSPSCARNLRPSP
nr:MAG TPA: hypothetical protein [Bacteriophage sp.]